MMWNIVVISEIGISRRTDYEVQYFITYLEEFKKYTLYKIDFEEESKVLTKEILKNEIVIQSKSLMEGYLHIPENIKCIYHLIAQFILCSSCDMIYGDTSSRKPKSNWNAVIVRSPKLLSSGICKLYIKKDNSNVETKILKTLSEMQNETYYTLDKGKMKYFIK